METEPPNYKNNMEYDAKSMAIRKARTHRHPDTLALGYIRYEAIRKMKLPELVELHKRNLRGERFDDMIDAAAGLIVLHNAEVRDGGGEA